MTNKEQLEKYLKLPQKGSVIAEYVWIDASSGVRSKCKVSLFLTIRPELRHAHNEQSSV